MALRRHRHPEQLRRGEPRADGGGPPGIVGGIRAWKENPEAAKEVIRRETKLEEGVLVDRSYEAVSEALEERPIPTEQLVSVPLETLAREGNEKAADADPGRSFDDRYIREALR